MVVIAILAILAAIAIPIYSKYVRDAKFSRAESNLVLLSTLMERYYQNNNAYPASMAPIPNTVPSQIPGWDPGNNPNPLFTYAIENPDPGMPGACNAAAISGGPSYLLTATPTATSGLSNQGIFYLDSNNNRCQMHANGTATIGW
jgi:type IV pilus assembly protein PilE